MIRAIAYLLSVLYNVFINQVTVYNNSATVISTTNTTATATNAVITYLMHIN